MSQLRLAPLDRGVRFVYATGARDRFDEDPALPFRVYVNLRPPEFMQVTFVMIHGGSEEVIVKAETLDSAENFLIRNELATHPRIRRIEITGPEGLKIERTDRARYLARQRRVADDDHRGCVNGWCVRCRRPVTQIWEGAGAADLCWINACDQRIVNNMENGSFEGEPRRPGS
jgi:hypothetical protein